MWCAINSQEFSWYSSLFSLIWLCQLGFSIVCAETDPLRFTLLNSFLLLKWSLACFMWQYGERAKWMSTWYSHRGLWWGKFNIIFSYSLPIRQSCSLFLAKKKMLIVPPLDQYFLEIIHIVQNEHFNFKYHLDAKFNFSFFWASVFSCCW